MTFEKLQQIVKENNIPHDVQLQSDSGYECCETEMNGAYYDVEENRLIFTQVGDVSDEWFDKNGVYVLYGRNRKCKECKYLNGSYCVVNENQNKYIGIYIGNKDTLNCKNFEN